MRLAGEPAGSEVERAEDPAEIDHLWITVRAGDLGLLQITVNTCSIRNRDLGFDHRVRMAIIPSTWNKLPASGLFAADAFDYSTIEAEHSVVFHEYERSTLELVLMNKINRARFVEGWGEFYVRGHTGIHQVHSRRASRVFPTDRVGRDGAIRFYDAEGRTEMALFKFFGQP